MGKVKELRLAGPKKSGSTRKDEATQEAKRRIFKAWGKILPFGAQVVASAAAYTVGVTATQLVGFVCKVSCATPVLGPCMGLLGVGLASALAGQASKHTHKMVSTGANPLKKEFWEPMDMDDVVLDALLGVFMFKAMGGHFNSLMPSDLGKPGALAFESIPARADSSESYMQANVKRELARIFKRDGCHHCGSHRGPVIGDYMPPNKLAVAAKSKEKLQTAIGELPGVSKVRELIGLAGRTGRPLQRFYPQCQRCSFKQATALRNGKRVLVLHLHAPRYRSEHIAGVFVGIRQNVQPVTFAEQVADTRMRRSVSKSSPLMLTAAAPAEAADENGSSSIVQDPSPAWEMPGYMPATAPPTSLAAQQQQQYGGRLSSSHSRQGGHHSGYTSNSSSGGHRQERQASGPQVLPGSLGLVQQQIGDVVKQNDRMDGTSLLVPEAAKQRADAAFERFTPGLAR